MSVPTQATPPPRWIPPWLAVLPAAYVLSPLALLALPQLRRLPRPVWWLLGFYALSQQLPALFAPEPMLASLLALTRTLLMLGLIGVGVALGDAGRLRVMGWGMALVFLTALAFTGLGGADLIIGRLSHPYMTPITLGLAGAFGVWIALFGAGKLLWRVPLGLLATSVLLLSGSRGALAAMLVGVAAGFVVRRGSRVAAGVLAGTALLAGGIFLGRQLDLSAVTRLSSVDTTGRDVLWYDVLSVIQSEPWGGVGSYRLGTRLTPPGGSCELFASPTGSAPECPAWVESLGNPWLIAHNVTLQQLAETGPLGLLGLFVLLGAVVVAAIQARSALGLAVVSGLLIATLNDNTLLVPSPFFAEVFWITAGTVLVRRQSVSAGVGLAAAGLMVGLSMPLLTLLRPPQAPGTVQIAFLNAPTTTASSEPYQVLVQFSGPPGKYRAALRSCLTSCVAIRSTSFEIGAGTSPVLVFESKLFRASTQQVELLLYPGRSNGDPRPQGRYRWEVTPRP